MKTTLLCFLSLFFASLVQAMTVPVLSIRDNINVGVSEHILTAIDDAEENGIPAVIIELDTPGGFLEATRDIVKKLLNTDVIVAVWVTPDGSRATSAGAMITMAAHYAAMSPSTSIGAATPVAGGGQDVPGDMKKKITNDTLSFVEGIAKKRDRNVEWAKQTVSDAASVEANKALELNAIDGIHETLMSLWEGMQEKYPELPKEVEFARVDFSTKDQILSFFSNPNVAYGLMALGALGIYIEMTNPGGIVPGAIGAVALALGAISMKIVPVQRGSLILFIVGLILIAIEIFVPVPTFGVAGILGGASIMLSGVFLIDPEQSNLGISLGIWIPVFIVGGLFCAWLGIAAAKALQSEGRKQGGDYLDGKSGEIVSVSQDGKKAKARFLGEIWNIEWEVESKKPFELGTIVIATKQDGFVAKVKEKK